MLRYPFGDSEWRGDWSESSGKWTPHLRDQIEQVMDELDIDVKDYGPEQGVFFMCVQDFQKYFTDIQVCKVDPNSKLSAVKIRSLPAESKYFKFQVKTDGYYYLGIHQRSKKFYEENSNYEYSNFSLLLGKVSQDGTIEFLEGLFAGDRNLWTKCKNRLTEGTYVVYLRHDSKETGNLNPADAAGQEIGFCLNVYGPKDVFLRELKDPKLMGSFLEEIFISKAKKNSDKW